MTHQRTIRTFSPFIITGLLLSLVGPGRAESAPSATAETPNVPAIPAPDLPSVPAPQTDTTQEENVPVTPISPSSEETMTDSAETTPAENTGGGDLEENPTSSEPNIAELAEQSKDTFSIFLQALEASGLKDQLLEKQDVTVFIPTNSAFEKLPDGVLENLLQEENQSILAKIIAHHVIDGLNPSSQLQTQEVTTLADSKASIIVSDEMVKIDEATVVQADLSTSNGIVHSIDTILIPPELR